MDAQQYIVDTDAMTYGTILVVNRGDPPIAENIFRWFGMDYEHTITKKDTIILNDNIINMGAIPDAPNSTYMRPTTLKYTYYSYGAQPHLPKSIESKTEVFRPGDIYIKLLEPQTTNDKQYSSKYLTQVFYASQFGSNYSMYKPSAYNCVYANIFTRKVCFSICKIEYNGETTSKYAVAYDKNIFHPDQVNDIIIHILVDTNK